MWNSKFFLYFSKYLKFWFIAKTQCFEIEKSKSYGEKKKDSGGSIVLVHFKLNMLKLKRTEDE